MDISGLQEELKAVKTKEPYCGYKYKLLDVLTIAILGTLCGLRNMAMIIKWANSMPVRMMLVKRFQIGIIPKYVQFTNILGNIDPKKLNEAFIRWASAMVQDVEGLTIAIDGKAIRSTTLHIVSAYATELGLTLGQVAVDYKKNEIPATQELLDLIDIHGAIVVADALNCQKKTAKKIVKNGGDYLLSVKKNHKNLHEDIETYFQNPPQKLEKAQTLEKNSGRIEKRTAYTSCDVDWLLQNEKGEKLTTIGAIHTEFEIGNKKTSEWHYYISSAYLTPKHLLKHAREEWGIETMHYMLDVHFDEDRCKVQDKNTHQTLNIFRKIALNLLKEYKNQSESKKPLSNIMAECLFDCNVLANFVLSRDFFVAVFGLLQN